MRRTGFLIALGLSSTLLLSACQPAPRSFSGPRAVGASFAVDVRVHWWQVMAIYVGNPSNGFAPSSVVAFISSATCEARGGFLPPRPTIEARTRSIFALREVLTGAQVARADAALRAGRCANRNPVSDFRNSVTGPGLSLVIASVATPTTVPPAP